jgi:hypothetical protein
MIEGKKILFLGAGQIGIAACAKILQKKPKGLIIHAFTKGEAEEAIESIRKIKAIQNADIELIPSWGNVFAFNRNFNVPRAEQTTSEMDELQYIYGFKTKERVESAFLWKLIETHKPELIVDAINTATAIGYKRDPYTASRNLFCSLKDDNFNNIKEEIKECLFSQAIPKLIRFTQVLHEAMNEFKVERYVKISTSGLGGMGFNISYTHGDMGEPGLSTKLLGKVAAAGILHQLLLTLSHTPGLDVKVIVPIALVGWENITTEIKGFPLVDCKQPIDLTDEHAIPGKWYEELAEPLKMVVVNSGENKPYAQADMTAITTLGQMGCITKEEVGKAAAETLEGSTRYDILTAMDTASMGPSFNAAFRRNHILATMKEKEENENIKFASVACGNLGPKVTKHLWELHILKRLFTTINAIMAGEPGQMARDARNLIEDDADLRRQILSLGMPILMEDNRFLIGKTWKCPENKDIKEIIKTFKEDKDQIENWARQGWVDLRETGITYWQDKIKEAHREVKECSQSSESGVLPLQRNWQAIYRDENQRFDIGEVLGLIYSIEGGDRKLY